MHDATPTGGAPSSEGGAKIMAVDDEPRVLRLVSEVLKAVGYRVITAATGDAAIEMVALEQPDLGGGQALG